MEENEQKVEQKLITFKLPPAEAEALDHRAEQAGMNRRDYLRLAIATLGQPRINELRDLLQYAIYLETQIYNGLFSIAEGEGKAKRFLSNAELKEINQRMRRDAIQYAVGFDEHFKAVMAELTAARKTAKPVEEK
jgi:Ribbon-helix-helix protein, copG family